MQVTLPKMAKGFSTYIASLKTRHKGKVLQKKAVEAWFDSDEKRETWRSPPRSEEEKRWGEFRIQVKDVYGRSGQTTIQQYWTNDWNIVCGVLPDYQENECIPSTMTGFDWCSRIQEVYEDVQKEKMDKGWDW
jgi:hypothetical protein